MEEGKSTTTTTPKRSYTASTDEIANRFKSVRNVAGKTLQRWATANSIINPTLLSPASSSSAAPSASTTPNSGVKTPTVLTAPISKSVLVDDGVLASLAARTPGCLFDERYLKTVEQQVAQRRSSTSSLPLLRVTEVQFPKHCGLTLEASAAFEDSETIYVKGFSSEESPALLSNAVHVGDLVLGASGRLKTDIRWLPNRRLVSEALTTLTDFSAFCREHGPLIIRFLTLTSPLALGEIHDDADKAALWVQFLTDTPEQYGENMAGEEEGADWETERLVRRMFEGRVMAQFAIDARAVLNLKDAKADVFAQVIQRHLMPYTRSAQEQQLVDWFNNSKRNGGGGEEEEEAAEPMDFDESMRALLLACVQDVEAALEVSYFPRFLHSRQAVEMFQLSGIAPQTHLLQTYWDLHQGFIRLTRLLQVRNVANVLFAFALQRYENIHQKILLYVDAEFELGPSLEAFGFCVSASEQRASAQQIYRVVRRMCDRFLANDGVCFCGQLKDDVNARMLRACLQLRRADQTVSLPVLVQELSVLLHSMQSQALEFLTRETKFLRDFCQSDKYFANVVDALYLGQDVCALPRFGALIPNLPSGLQDHRGGASPSPHSSQADFDLIVKAVFVLREEPGQDGMALDPSVDPRSLDVEGLRKFAFPWHGKQQQRLQLDNGEASELQEGEEIAFPYIISKGDGTKLFGISRVAVRMDPDALALREESITLISDSRALFSLLPRVFWDASLMQSAAASSSPHANVILDKYCLVETPYGLGRVVPSAHAAAAGDKTIVVNVQQLDQQCYLPFYPSELRGELAAEQHNAALEFLLESLSIRNLLQVFAHLLLEKKVLLVSTKYTVLTMVGECLCALLFPLQWSHVYAPLLPRKMLDLLMCPTPFLLGIHRDYAFKGDFPFAADLCVVDLDADEVNSSEASCRLPREMEDAIFLDLKCALSPQTMGADSGGSTSSSTNKMDKVRQVFRRAVANLLSGLPKACFSITHHNEVIRFVDESFWFRAKSPELIVFLSQFARTQQFSGYLVQEEE